MQLDAGLDQVSENAAGISTIFSEQAKGDRLALSDLVHDTPPADPHIPGHCVSRRL